MKKLLAVALISILLFGCKKSDDNPVETQTKDPIIGTWISTGSNVAPLLNTIFASVGGIDSIYATFNENNTYYVKQVNKNKTSIVYEGTYVLTKSTNTDIHKISIVQTKPSAASNEGIYQINTSVNPNTMKYEVVLISGTQNTAPTPEKGFGSTNNGAFGTTNVQNYVKKN
ncbi:MAG: hypothetical protein ACOYU5_01625 [Stygiobacter sp.]